MFRFLAATFFAVFALGPAVMPAAAFPLFDKEAADRIVEARSTAAWRNIGVPDHHRFNLLKKALAAGTADDKVLADGIELGRRHLDSEPLFAGSVFGAITQAGQTRTLPAARYGEALYWNAVAYDRICERDGELCQMLAVSILAEHPGSASLKASALRYMAYVDAAGAALLSPDLKADAARQCSAARDIFAGRAEIEARAEHRFYAEQLRAPCGAGLAAAAPR
ncbi:MAG: hypothetical protein WD034_06360 [Parvibaculum sp.]